MVVDPYNTIRSKSIPIDTLLKKQVPSLDGQASLAEACCGALPTYSDAIQDGTGIDARRLLSLQADPASLRVLPYAPKTAVVMADLKDQFTKETSALCARSLLRRVVRGAASRHDIAFNVGAELEFCLVKKKNNKSIDGDNIAFEFADQSLFATTVTLNDNEEFIDKLYTQLQQQDIPVELIHSESGPGQLEVVLEYSIDPIVLCDNIVLAKETIHAVAKEFGYNALFLPKYNMMKAGNGLHIHVSTREASTGKSNFSNGSIDGGFKSSSSDALTQQASSFIEGVLQHLPAIMGLSLPTTNSYRRIRKGCWTGSVVGWALEDKEVGIRVCSNLTSNEWDHVECKFFDSTANPYLSLAALLLSGLSGIQIQAKLRPSIHDSKHLDPQPLPSTVGDALNALESDPVLTSAMGGKLTKAYLKIRRHDAERASTMTIEEEFVEALQRC
jgi:glutamine synthetase